MHSVTPCTRERLTRRSEARANANASAAPCDELYTLSTMPVLTLQQLPKRFN